MHHHRSLPLPFLLPSTGEGSMDDKVKTTLKVAHHGVIFFRFFTKQGAAVYCQYVEANEHCISNFLKLKSTFIIMAEKLLFGSDIFGLKIRKIHEFL